MKISLYIGDNELDLFKDENIEINSSVVDIENIESNTTEFSKDFTVPASNKNNRTFKHYYNSDIDNGFDARIKVDGKILINGFVFKLGKFRLSKVIVKDNKPSSYTIQFWGNLLNLKDVLGNAELSDLDLSAYDHNYNSTVVKTGLTNSLFGSNLIYNLFSKRQYYYNSSLTDHDDRNIAYTDGLQDNGVKWNELRPSIRLSEIINAIEVYSGITFSDDFFSRSEFQNLFLWLNPDADKNAGGDTQIIDWDSGDADYINLTTNKGTFEVSTSFNWDLYLKIIPSAGYEDINYTVKFYKDDSLISEITKAGTQTLPKYNLNVSDAPADPYNYNVYFEVETSQQFKYSAEINQYKKAGVLTLVRKETFASENTITSQFIISEELPKMKILDFLKGLFKMFKLVVIPTDYNNLYVNTLVDYYASGELYDVTKYIDNESYEVNRGKLLNEINFTFEEPTTILNLQYEKNNDRAYGDEENQIKDENDKLLDGETLDYKVPFEQIIYERLVDLNTSDAVNIQYGLIADENLESANPKAHIFYNLNVDLETTNIGFINDLGVKESLSDSLNIPSHTMTLDNIEYSTVFHEEFSEWNFNKINKTLYSNYHKNYIDSIFNPKRRDYKFNAKLPFKILNKLELNDVLKIRENYYRINDYNLNLTNGLTDLNLISSFDLIINDFKADNTNVFVDYKAQSQSTYINNLGIPTFNKIDNGYGTDWVSVSYYLSSVFFSFAYNDTGLTRDMFVDVTNTILGKTIRFYLNQESILVLSLDFSREDNSVLYPIFLT